MSEKRQDYISWDEYFMGVAKLSGMRSKDPNSQVGSCIVSQNNKILSMGYNGFPMGCSDDEFPWAREGEDFDTKYFYVTHSELAGIKTIVYGSDKYGDTPAVKASKRMLDAAGVRYYQYSPTGRKIELEL